MKTLCHYLLSTAALLAIRKVPEKLVDLKFNASESAEAIALNFSHHAVVYVKLPVCIIIRNPSYVIRKTATLCYIKNATQIEDICKQIRPLDPDPLESMDLRKYIKKGIPLTNTVHNIGAPT
jgi:hypothetical protein